MAQKARTRGTGAVKRGKKWTETQAREALDRAERSGKSLWRYARESGLNGQRLHWWKARLAKPKDSGPRPSRQRSPQLAPVILTGGATTAAVAVVRIGDVEIDVMDPEKVGGVWLRDVAAELGARR